MRATIALSLCALLPLAAAAEETATDGVISGEWGYVEILPEAPPPGTTIELREGWIRVESAPDDEEPGSGSFGVIHSEALAQRPDDRVRTVPQPGLRAGPGYREAEPPRHREPAGPPALRDEPQDRRALRDELVARDAGLGPCYVEREKYVKELFRIAGIEGEVDHPLALLAALGDTPGLSPWVRFNLFGLPGGGPWGASWIDPVRPLAWDDGLQWVARDLERCMRRELGFDDRLIDPDLERREGERTAEPQRGERPVPPRPRDGSL